MAKHIDRMKMYEAEFASVSIVGLSAAINQAYPGMTAGKRSKICRQLTKRKTNQQAQTEQTKLRDALTAAGIEVDTADYVGDGEFSVKVKSLAAHALKD